MRSLILILTTAGISLTVHAADLGFRFNGKACVDSSGEAGLNPGYFGQCADLRGATVSGIDFTNVDFSGSNFEHANFSTDSFAGANLTATSFRSATLDGAILLKATVHGTDFTGASMVNAHFAGSDIQNCIFQGANLAGDDFSTMNLAGNSFLAANLTGAIMDDADLNHVDLSGANLTQANLQRSILDGAQLANATLTGANLTSASMQGIQAAGSQFGSTILRKTHLQKADVSGSNLRTAQLDEALLTGANFQNTDLRSASLAKTEITGTIFTGATINKLTALPITTDAALKLGMKMAKGGIYILWDGAANEADAFVKTLTDLGLEVAISTEISSAFAGDIDLSIYSVVFHFGTTDGVADMPTAGQTSLLNFVKSGGTYILTGEDAYKSPTFYQQMKDLILFSEKSEATATLVLSAAPTQTANPIVAGLKFPLNMQSGAYTVANLIAFTDHPSTVLITDGNGDAAVVQREVGAGHSIQISRGDSEYATMLTDPAVQQLVAAIALAY